MNKRDLHLVVVSKPRREIVIPQQFGRFNAQDLAKVREVFSRLHQERKKQLAHAR